MRIFIFDFRGTLTVLPDPLGFLGLLREQNDGAKVVLWTGSTESDICALAPGLIQAVDAWCQKPGNPVELMQQLGWQPSEVVVADDEPMMLRVARRMFSGEPIQVTTIGPEALGSLVRPLLE